MSAYPGVTLSGLGKSAPIDVSPPQNMMWQAAPAYALGLIATVSAGASLTYSVQVTADQIPTNANSGFWNEHDEISAKSASENSNIGYPVTGVRLVVTGWVSGSVHLGVAQWP